MTVLEPPLSSGPNIQSQSKHEKNISAARQRGSLQHTRSLDFKTVKVIKSKASLETVTAKKNPRRHEASASSGSWVEKRR